MAGRAVFDLEKKRRIVLQTLPYALAARDPTSAGSYLTDAVYAFICGLDVEGARIAENSLRELAGLSELDRPEKHKNIEPRMYSVFFDEAERFRSLALARWLVTGSPDRDSSRSALEFMEKSVEAGRSLHPHAGNLTLDWYMADAVQAGECERAMAYNEREERGADKPINLNRIQSPRRAAFALCRHLLLGEWTIEDMRQVVERLLARNMPGWLANGHSKEGAYWLKIRYVHLDSGLLPKEVLVKALQYLGKRPS